MTTVDLRHLPQVKYHRATDSYFAQCPGCDWTAAPSLDTAALHRASKQHHEDNTTEDRRLNTAHTPRSTAPATDDLDYRLSSL